MRNKFLLPGSCLVYGFMKIVRSFWNFVILIPGLVDWIKPSLVLDLVYLVLFIVFLYYYYFILFFKTCYSLGRSWTCDSPVSASAVDGFQECVTMTGISQVSGRSLCFFFQYYLWILFYYANVHFDCVSACTSHIFLVACWDQKRHWVLLNWSQEW